MANTILERLQEKYPEAPGINDARNIAEAIACITNIGGRGANAIADYIDAIGLSTVLYTDGLLIINEKIEDRETNIAEHGEVVKEYEPWCTMQPYEFDNVNDIPWYVDRNSVLSVKFGSIVKPLSMDIWFHDCASCASIDTTNLDTSQCTSMDNTFNDCSALTSVDVSGFDTSNVTSMSHIFYNCSALTSVDVSGFDTSKVKNFNSMFAGCTALTDLDVSGFDTSNVTDMAFMFQACQAITSFDASGFDTSKVTTLKGMFTGCIALQVIDLSIFDTARVTDMSGMFYSDSNLETVYASDKFVTDAVTKGMGMFLSCTSLVGGNGTTYDANHVDAEYARIDTAETPGYFTAASA